MRIAVLVALTLLSCQGPDDGETKPVTATFATYNAGLAVSFVPAARSRLPVTAAAIGAIEADVVCLQEVWEPEQVEAVSTAASAYPHQYWPEAEPLADPGPGCSVDEMDTLSFCLEGNCGDICPDDLADCFLTYCGIPFFGVSPDCQSCVMANVGDDPEPLIADCSVQTSRYAYGGSYGTGILSKHPLSNQEHLVLDSTTNRRGVLHATADVDGVEIDVYCTHLTANLAPLPYTGPGGDWGGEQAMQIDTLHAWIDDTRGKGTPVVLMGDMNTGPEGEGAVADLPENWIAFEQYGWEAPAVELGVCTMCSDNLLRDEGSSGYLIDHVLLDGLTTDSVERILDGTTTVENCDAEVEVSYSDHYGVSVVATTQ